MTTLDPATRQLLQRSIYAYMQQYGGQSLLAARAIAGALLAVQEKAGALVAQGLEIEQWVDALVENFAPQQIGATIQSEVEQRLASQAKNWRNILEAKTRDTLDAYIQTYTPALDSHKIQALVTTILPIVEDATITRDEAYRVIKLVSEQVDVEAAIARVVDPKWLWLAEKTAQVMQLRAVETTATDVVSAYVYEFQPTAVEIGEALIERTVQAISNNKVKLGLDVNLDPETRKLLVKQVMLKLHLRTASPAPAKTALEIAQQIHSEVVRFRREQGLDTVDYIPSITQVDDQDGSSSLGGELSIGLERQPSATHQDANATETTNNG